MPTPGREANWAARGWLASRVAILDSSLAVWNFRLAPTSSVSISVTERRSPSGVSQAR